MEFFPTCSRRLHSVADRPLFHAYCMKSMHSVCSHRIATLTLPNTFLTCIGYAAPPRELFRIRNKPRCSSTQVATLTISVLCISLQCLARLLGCIDFSQKGQVFEVGSFILWSCYVFPHYRFRHHLAHLLHGETSGCLQHPLGQDDIHLFQQPQLGWAR